MKKNSNSNQGMIDVYSWATPNGHKVHIMLEECGYQLDRDWRAIPIDIGKGNQFTPAFLKISPNNKIPAITDPNGPDGKPIHLFESGAILLYLAAKTARFLPNSTRAKYEVLQWLMFQMGGLGPLLGQNHHFRLYAPKKIDYAIERYTNEAKRLYGVLDRQLATIGMWQEISTRLRISPFSRGSIAGKNKALRLLNFPMFTVGLNWLVSALR